MHVTIHTHSPSPTPGPGLTHTRKTTYYGQSKIVFN